ncbi:MAG: hypothetical protein HY241_06510 [Actinobacteria bacterium]|nr:hypothetical protein [Actinomycetota bacterium]
MSDSAYRQAAEPVAQLTKTMRRAREQGHLAVEGLHRAADRPPGSCSLSWGVCPDDGDTLITTEGTSTCTVCARQWNYPRAEYSCTEPAVLLLNRQPICAAHARSAPPRAHLTPMPDPMDPPPSAPEPARAHPQPR